MLLHLRFMSRYFQQNDYTHIIIIDEIDTSHDEFIEIPNLQLLNEFEFDANLFPELPSQLHGRVDYQCTYFESFYTLALKRNGFGL